MDGRMMDLDSIFKMLPDTPEFFDQGDPDAGSLTWPEAPSDTALKWPLVLLKCPKGHEIGMMNLSFDSGTWTLHSHSDIQAMPAMPGDRSSPYAGALSLQRTRVVCAKCQRKRPGKRQALPVRGAMLLLMYVEAVEAKKTTIHLS